MKLSFSIYLFMFCLYSTFNYAQTCNVLQKDISEHYKGKCKDGLAHGKGHAKGIDSYSGFFVKGLPEGKGKYTYKNGNVFTGFFVKGKKHGEGKFNFSISGKKQTLKGFWKNDEYIGPKSPDTPFSIIVQNGIENIRVNQLNNVDQKIKLSFFIGLIKRIPANLEINSSNGIITRNGMIIY